MLVFVTQSPAASPLLREAVRSCKDLQLEVVELEPMAKLQHEFVPLFVSPGRFPGGNLLCCEPLRFIERKIYTPVWTLGVPRKIALNSAYDSCVLLKEPMLRQRLRDALREAHRRFVYLDNRERTGKSL